MQNMATIPVQAKEENDGMHYFLHDASGNPCHIVENAQQIHIYKEVRIGKETIPVQFIPRNTIVPHRMTFSDIKWDSIKNLIRSTWKYMRQLSKPPFPAFLQNPDFSFWVDPSHSNRVVICNKEGTCFYQLQFSRRLGHRVLEKAARITSSEESSLQRVETLDDTSHPLWQAFTAFDDSTNILLWKGKKGEVERIEFFRFNLVFEKQEDQLVCLHPDYEGWVIHEKDLHSMATKGVPGALVLTHPTEEKTKKIILPKHTFDNEERDITTRELVRFAYAALSSQVQKKLPAFKEKDPLRLPLFDKQTLNVSLLSFDLDSHTDQWTTGSPEALDPFLYLTQICSDQRNWESAFLFFQQAKKQSLKPLTKEQTKALKNLLDHPEVTPKRVAFQLQIALFLYEKGESNDEMVARLNASYKKYMEYGHKIPELFRLNQEQTNKILSLDATKRPSPIIQQKKWSRGVVQREVQVPKIAHELFQTLQVQKEREEEFQEAMKKKGVIMRRLRPLKDPSQFSFSERKISVLTEHFDKLYDIIQKEGLQGEKFLRTEAFLQSIDEERGGSSLDALPFVLKNYLLQVIDLKRKGEDLKILDLSSPQKLQSFFQNIQNAIESLPHEEEVQEAIPSPEDFTDLLVALETPPREALPLPMMKASGGALFEKSMVDSFFQEQSAVSPSHQVPTLALLDKETEPSIVVEKKRVIQEVSVALDAKKSQTQHILRNEEDRKPCLAQVQEKQKQAAQCAQEKKQTVLDLFQVDLSSIERMQKMAGFMPSVEIADILRACLQNDWERLDKALPKGRTREEVKTHLLAYIDAASQEVRCRKAIEVLQEMESKKGGIQPAASETLYQILTAERQYDPKDHLHLAALELYLGFLLRSNQIETVIEMVNDPKMIKQAATGSGKTSVINFLKGVMLANGSNLVTMVFPKELFQENIAYLHQNLGKLYDRNTYILEFSEDTPPHFAEIYKRLNETVQQQGVVATTRESLQALEKSFLKQIYLASISEDLSSTQTSNLVHIAKILDLFDKKSIFNIDEFDSILSPKQRQDLALVIGKSVPYPAFYREEALRIYDKLLKIEALGLEKNIQAEQFAKEGNQALETVAKELIVEWKKEGIDHKHLFGYFFSTLPSHEEKEFLNAIATTASPQQKDRLALTKDLLTTFIPLTLQKKEDGKYTRSANGIDTVNCSSPGKAKEGSKPKEILETMCQTIQDYIYRGVSPTKVQEIVQSYAQLAERELNPFGKDPHEKNETKTPPGSIDATRAAKQLQERFPKDPPFLLSSLCVKENETAVQELTDWINGDYQKKRTFLEEQLSRITDAGATISCSSANFVSMSPEVGGASATTGNPFAYPSQMHNDHVTTPGTVGEMVLNLQAKVGEKKIEKYSPETPLPELMQIMEKAGAQSFVDGGVALCGLEAKTIAENLIDQLPESTQGVAFFDRANVIRIMKRDKKIYTPKAANIARHELSMVLLAAHSRGADVQVGSKNHLVITDNAFISLEEKLQHFGRSRKEGHEITLASPEGDPINTIDDVIATGVLAGALEGADNLVRAKQQELEDGIRRNMVKNLMGLATEMESNPQEKSRELFSLFKRYQEDPQQQFLVQVGQKEFAADGSYTEGTYFALHGNMVRKNRSPKEILKEKVAELQEIAMRYSLEEAKESLLEWTTLLEAHDPIGTKLRTEADDQLLQMFHSVLSHIRNQLSLSSEEEALERLKKFDAMMMQMPTLISGKGGHDTEVSIDVDTETEIDTETEVDTETQIDVQVSGEKRKEAPHYLPWLSCGENHFKFHTLNDFGFRGYDSILRTTENEHPLGRKEWADPIFHRTAHDASQMPIYYVECKIDPSGECRSAIAIDPLELPKNTMGKLRREGHWSVVYDLRANQICRIQQPYRAPPSIPRKLLKNLPRPIAQMRFEDGQYQRSNYTKGQWEALKEWLREQSLDEAESYFVREV